MMREMIPLLVDAVRDGLVQRGGPPANALDALIQLHADVPEAVLREVLPVSQAEALILLSQGRSESSELLLEIVAQKIGIPWYAAGNLLLARREPAFVLHLLSTLRISLTVTVSEDGESGVGFGGGGPISIGCGAGAMMHGYPPLAAYQLSPFASPGSVVLSTGPKPVYYRRVVAEAGMSPVLSSLGFSGPSIAERLEYIAAALHELPERLALRASYHESLKKTDSLPAAVAARRREIEFGYSLLVKALIERGLISEEQASTLPALTIDVEVHQAQ